MDDELRNAIVLFRYGVISDLVAQTLAPGDKERLLDEISQKTWTIPGTDRERVGSATTRRGWFLTRHFTRRRIQAASMTP